MTIPTRTTDLPFDEAEARALVHVLAKPWPFKGDKTDEEIQELERLYRTVEAQISEADLKREPKSFERDIINILNLSDPWPKGKEKLLASAEFRVNLRTLAAMKTRMCDLDLQLK